MTHEAPKAGMTKEALPDECREAFEKWCYGRHSIRRDKETGEYIEPRTHFAWEAWQARPMPETNRGGGENQAVYITAAAKKYTDPWEYLWDEWYGFYRGQPNVEAMSRIIEGAKRIAAKQPSVDVEALLKQAQETVRPIVLKEREAEKISADVFALSPVESANQVDLEKIKRQADFWQQSMAHETWTLHDFIDHLAATGHLSPRLSGNGWVLVPREPTPEMIDAAFNRSAINSILCEGIYRAMIAAAPSTEGK